MKKTALALAVMVLLTGCATAAPADTQQPSASASQSPSLLPFQELSNAVDVSITKMMATGITEKFEINGQLFYTGVYDPNFVGDYRGAGLMSESDQVDLLLELDMYGLYQLARAVSNSPIEATTKDGEGYLVTIDPNRKGLQGFPTSMRATLGTDGLVARVEYPAEREPDAVNFVYAIDALGTDILTRANEQIAP